MARKTSRTGLKDIVRLADLAPKHRVVGGSDRRVFGADSGIGRAEPAATRKAVKDLPAKGGNVKGGGRNLNDNITLVRGAKPAKNDLSASKDVKAGKKAARSTR